MRSERVEFAWKPAVLPVSSAGSGGRRGVDANDKSLHIHRPGNGIRVPDNHSPSVEATQEHRGLLRRAANKGEFDNCWKRCGVSSATAQSHHAGRALGIIKDLRAGRHRCERGGTLPYLVARETRRPGRTFRSRGSGWPWGSLRTRWALGSRGALDIPAESDVILGATGLRYLRFSDPIHQPKRRRITSLDDVFGRLSKGDISDGDRDGHQGGDEVDRRKPKSRCGLHLDFLAPCRISATVSRKRLTTSK